MSIKTKSGADLRKLLETLRSETRPIDGHSAPGAIEDCWNKVFETLFPPAPSFAPGDEVVHVDYKHYGVGQVKEISKSGKRALVKFPPFYATYFNIEKLRPAPKGEGE